MYNFQPYTKKVLLNEKTMLDTFFSIKKRCFLYFINIYYYTLNKMKYFFSTNVDFKKKLMKFDLTTRQKAL